MSTHRLRVARVIQETADARSFVFDVPPELGDAFRYRAGQFLTFHVEYEGKVLSRCYSLSSTPELEEAPKVTVKRVEDGRISNWFNDHVKEGDVLEVMPPSGLFVLKERETPLLMFAGGSGITPIVSIVKTALLTTRRRIRLVYANRDRDSIIFRDELDALARKHPDRLAVVHRLDDEQGFLDVPAAREALAGFEDADFYICGPGPFMDVVEAAIEERATPRERIFIERFVSPADPEERAPAPETPAGAAVPEAITVTLDGDTEEVPYEEGKSILQAARDAGLCPPFACEDGYCGSCMARLKQGEVAMAVNDVLSEKELASGLILTCQARPTTAVCEVEYED